MVDNTNIPLSSMSIQGIIDLAKDLNKICDLISSGKLKSLYLPENSPPSTVGTFAEGSP